MTLQPLTPATTPAPAPTPAPASASRRARDAAPPAETPPEKRDPSVRSRSGADVRAQRQRDAEARLAAAETRATRRRLAREMRELPPPLDTRLALLASVAEIRLAMVPPPLARMDLRH